jgi:nicotinate dehydrogenase subunit B
MTAAFTRRALLQSGAALVVSFTLDPRDALGQQPTGAPDVRAPLDARDVDSFLTLHPDGRVTIFTSKVDVGTGMRIAIAQMAAEELGVPLARVSLIDGDTGRCPNNGGTGGSTGLTRGGTAVRQAAATARQALLRLASGRLGVPASELTIVNGDVRRAGTTRGRSIPIARLLDRGRFTLAVDANAPLVASASYAVVGTSPLRPDVPDKSTGRYTYIQDVVVPDMLHARVLRPPSIGARLTSVDEASIAKIPGVRVVRIESFVAVVSKDEWAAIRASRELKTTWTEWQGLPDSRNL